MRFELLDAGLVLLVQDEPVKNSQDLLAVTVDFLKGFPEGHLEIRRSKPLIEHIPRYINILAQVFYRMSTEEQSVKEGRLPLWG